MNIRHEQELTRKLVSLSRPELVAEVFACPRCGNRDMNSLVWMNDDAAQMEYVECGACGAWYDPSEE